ncbi:MAG: signal transduction protein [endosymbiont of Galathealinum brachiosum]|uniref:Signal transduction protein n=1 Tax=endosymbiont of Galathealinum brachiosum TaxID=2200906 RepID=A0A370D6U9_9GAMM|nr:MAG: signal transduction protein [endosymbiont of Galathealinum brachiosum]
MIVQDIMNTAVKTANADTLIKDIASIMCFNKISGMPVVDSNEKLIGVLSEKDILKAMFPDVEQIMQEGAKTDFESIEADYKGLLDKKAEDFMTQTVASVSADMPLLKAASLMCVKKIRRIPVTDSSNKLVGIISIGDVHKAIFQDSLLKSNSSDEAA